MNNKNMITEFHPESSWSYKSCSPPTWIDDEVKTSKLVFYGGVSTSNCCKVLKLDEYAVIIFE